MYDNIIIDSKFIILYVIVFGIIYQIMYLYVFGIGSGFVLKLSEMGIVQSVTFDASVTGI